MSTSVDERITDEVEALGAILMNDVLVKCVDNVPNVIETVVHPSTGDDIDQRFVCVTLEVKLTPGYPEKSPEVTLRNPRGLDDELLAHINSQIKLKLKTCLGLPVIFELIELIRENLTESNLPSGQCVICLFEFTEGDVFTKTQCYHHFHSHCLANHLIAGQKYYNEELEKLPHWQQVQAPPFKPTCPVCRCHLTCNVEALQKAPQPVASLTAEPFCLTAELRALQAKMAALLARQVARGGVVGVRDPGPRPLTITTPEDHNRAAVNGGAGGSHVAAKAEALGSARPNGSCSAAPAPPGPAAAPAPAPAPAAPAAPAPAPAEPHVRPYRGPYRGFNRRGKPGRRGRGAR